MGNYFNFLAKLCNQNVIFPFYHSVSNSVPAHLKHLYPIKSNDEFEQDLKLYKKYFEAITINDLNSKKKLKKTYILISFDDGLREFKTNAFPLIKQYGFTPILFVNTGFVDNKDLFFRFKISIIIDKILKLQNINFTKIELVTNIKTRSYKELVKYLKSLTYNDLTIINNIANLLKIDFKLYLKKHKPYLTLNELKELNQQGVIIGAHSIDHPLFNKLDLNQQIMQIKESTNWVQTHFNQSISTFSFPFTDFGLTKNLFDKIYNNKNFKLHYTFGTAGIKKEHYKQHLQRIPMENGKLAKNTLLYQYIYFLCKAPLFKNTIKR